MTSETAFKKVLCPLDCKFGAPMERTNIGEKPTDGTRVFDRKVPLSQGYDKGGAYWGDGAQLRVEYTADLSFIRFYRVEYTVCFCNWYNNHSQPDTPEYYNTLTEAKNRAYHCHNLTTDAIGNNNYVTNGVEAWVEWYERGESHHWNP